MRIAIDISPLQTGHKVRGIGFYLRHLQQALINYFPQHQYLFFTQKMGIPQGVDIIHFPFFDPFFITLPLVKTTKTVVTVHDLTPLVFPQMFPSGVKGNLRWQVQKQLLKRADAIITDSNCSKKDIENCTGYPSNKIYTVYLAAGEEFRQISNHKSQITNLKKKYNLPEKFALYVGDATWNKNLPRLVEAAGLANIPLVMIGKALQEEEKIDSTNPWNNDLMKTIKMAKQNKNIYRLGFVSDDDLVLLYNSATVFIMPSLYEGFGLPILEAMACDLPVITSKKGSLPEVAADGAYYVDADNVENISHGLQKVFGSVSLQKSLSARGLEQVKKFSWKKTAEETVHVYEKVFASK